MSRSAPESISSWRMMTYLHASTWSRLCQINRGMASPAPRPTVVERPFFRSKRNFAGVQDGFPLRRTFPVSFGGTRQGCTLPWTLGRLAAAMLQTSISTFTPFHGGFTTSC